MTQDFAHSITIPLQREIVARDTHLGAAFVVPPELLQAIASWQCIRDDNEAYKVGRRIQDWIDGVSDAQQIALEQKADT